MILPVSFVVVVVQFFIICLLFSFSSKPRMHPSFHQPSPSPSPSRQSVVESSLCLFYLSSSYDVYTPSLAERDTQ